MYQHLQKTDPETYQWIMAEYERRATGLELIPSENFASPAVLDALGSIMTDKYSEGYPGIRYYGGCENVDAIENIARERAKKLFGVTHANVQPYSGSPANQAVYFATLQPGDTVMGSHLFFGGHMTHGLKVNFSGTIYNSVQYTARKDGFVDFDEIEKLAREHKPKLMIVGATAYPRRYDWQAFKVIADMVGAYMMADISHIAGLVIAGEHPSPAGIADIITTTTHKTLRGPRGAIILCNGEPSNPLKAPPEKSKKYLPTMIDRAIIPGLQGGPHNHQTAAIAVALHEASQPSFKEYGKQIVRNAKALADVLLENGFQLVTGGTDNHLILTDVTSKGPTGAEAEKALDRAGITVNKNTIPHDPRKPFDPSGIRMGTPAVTTLGMKEPEMKLIGNWITQVVEHWKRDEIITQVRKEVKDLMSHFPVYPGLQ